MTAVVTPINGRPTPLAVVPEGIPLELRQERRWVGWRYERRRDGLTKVPYVGTAPDCPASATDTRTWRTFAETLTNYRAGRFDGIGFVLGDPFVGFDADGVGLDDGLTREYFALLNTYTERSPSGNGLHAICRGTKVNGKCRADHYELYDKARYFTVTGHHVDGFPQAVEERTQQITLLSEWLFGSQSEEPKRDVPTSEQGDLNDEEIIARASRKERFARLFNRGEWQGLYPSQSEADLSLCKTLAFWTQRHPKQIDRLFRRSKLYRPKWDERRGAQTYGELTIDKAVQSVEKVYVPKARTNGHRTVKLTFANTIKPKPVRWLWEGRLGLGTFGHVAGREGVGKSTFVYSILADITQGRLAGVWFGKPRTVIVAATEDDWAHTIIPRLMAAGADLSRVGRVDVVTSNGGNGALSLPLDTEALADVVRREQAVCVLLDPLISRLDTKLDTHKDADVRQALEPLVEFAQLTNTVVLGIIHVNKGSSRDPLNMVMGSRAFTAVARAVLFVAEDPEDENKRVVGQAKNDLGRCDLPTLTFEIEDALVASTEEGDIRTGRLKWTEDTDRTIKEIVEQAAVPREDRTAKAEAAEWLKVFLLQHRGVAESSVIKREGKKAGHSESALRRARKEIGVTSQSTTNFPRRTFWLTPGTTVDLCALAEDGVHEPSGPETRVEF